MCSSKTDVSPASQAKSNFSLSVLKKLLTQENSCVSCITCQRSIDITPLHLADLKTSIRDLLDEKVNKYDVELQGVVLAHKNVRIVAESIVLSDNRCFPLEYVSDIYVFKPQIGSKLTGVVNKIPPNREYVSVLVHNIFNVVVYAAHKQPKPAVIIGSSVNVTVTYIDFTGRLPFIRAEISSEELNGFEEMDGMDEEMFPPRPLTTPVRKGLTSILKNSPARIHLSSTDVETESSCAENGTVNQGAGTSKDEVRKKKKKKKDKERKNTNEAEKEVTSHSKKRKRHDENGESPSPSKKKKRKHRDESREDSSLTEGNGDVAMNDMSINPLDSTAQIMADVSIMKAASSTPVLGPPRSPKKKKRTKSAKELPDLSTVQQAVLRVKSELRTADSGISSSDEKKSDKAVKVKVKRESFSSQSSSKGESVEETNGTREHTKKKKKKKKKKKREIKSESVADITSRLLEEALKDLKTEK